MRRILQFLFLLLVLVLAAAFILPQLYRDEIMAKIKEEANKNLNATLEFRDLNLSLFSSFPALEVGLEGLSLKGIEDFEGRELIAVEDLSAAIDVLSLIQGEAYQINEISAQGVELDLLILPDGRANFDIMKESEAPVDTAPAAESSPFQIALQSYRVEGLHLRYVDQQGEMYFELKNLNHQGQGDFTEKVVALKTFTEVAAVEFAMEGIKYLHRVQAESQFDFKLDQEAFRFDFGENYLTMNGLRMNFEGWLAMPEEQIDMDLRFKSENSEFKSVLSLIPQFFYQDFEGLKSSGQFDFQGAIKGTYDGVAERYPGFDLGLQVRNGSFQYPDLPGTLEEMQADLKINNASGNPDDTRIKLSQLLVKLDQSQFRAALDLKTPLSDPDFAFMLNGKLDLASLTRLVPLEGYKFKGIINSDLSAKGRASFIETEQYDAVQAQGTATAENLYIGGDSLDMELNMPIAQLSLKPQTAELSKATLLVGQSDLNFSGRLDNLLAYALGDSILKGDLNLSSSYLRMADFMEESSAEASTSAADSAAPLEVVRLPQDLKIAFKAKIDSLDYDSLMIRNIDGSFDLEGGVASLNKVQMDMLEGRMLVSGTYDSRPEIPEFDFDLAIQDFSFRRSYDQIGMVQSLAPVMANTTGNYSTNLHFFSRLGADMSPDLNSIAASGRLNTSDLITSGSYLSQLATYLNNPKYQQLNVKPINLSFEIKDGRVEVEPFDMNIGGQKATAGGSSGLDQSLDFKVDTELPLSAVKAKSLVAPFESLGISKVPFSLLIGGELTKPTIKPSFGDLGSQLKNKVKEQISTVVDSAKTRVKDELNKQKEKLIKEAEAQGDRLVAEARQQGERLKSEAATQAKRIREEGEKAAQKILSEAGNNPLKKVAAERLAEETRKQANQKADKLEQEANKQANALVSKAEAEKERLINEAKNKS